VEYENISNWTFGENKPKQTQFQRQKMLLRMTINGRRNSFGYYTDEIEAAKAYDRLSSVRFPAIFWRGKQFCIKMLDFLSFLTHTIAKAKHIEGG
jgi:hypothetical protein